MWSDPSSSPFSLRLSYDTPASLVVDSVRPSLDFNFEPCLPVRIAAYKLDVIHLSLAQSLPTTASYRHSNDNVLCVPPHRPQSAPIVSPSSQNTQECKTPLLARLPSHHRAVHLAYLPLHVPAAATLPLPARLPCRHQPVHLAHLPPRSVAAAMAETSLHSTRISYTPQLSTRPVPRPASRGTKLCA